MDYPIYPASAAEDQETFLVTGLFDTVRDVENVLNILENEGFTQEDIAIAMTDETRGKSFSIEKRSKAVESAAGFGALGGVGGAIIAAIMSAGTAVSGGMNLVIAGPVLSALAGFGAGSLAGGFFGALIGAGIPEYEIDFYKDALQNGNVLIAVKAQGPEKADLVKGLFEQHNVVLKSTEWQIDDLARQSL